MKILFLDDNNDRIEFFRKFNPDAHIAIQANDCMQLLKERTYDLLCLDHDLGERVFVNSNNINCGMEVVRFLETQWNISKNTFIIVHSWNFEAAKEMVYRLTRLGYKAVHIPFSFNNTFIVN